jgi:hypothetical protein
LCCSGDKRGRCHRWLSDPYRKVLKVVIVCDLFQGFSACTIIKQYGVL